MHYACSVLKKKAANTLKGSRLTRTGGAVLIYTPCPCVEGKDACTLRG